MKLLKREGLEDEYRSHFTDKENERENTRERKRRKNRNKQTNKDICLCYIFNQFNYDGLRTKQQSEYCIFFKLLF